LEKLGYIAIAGALGTLARYGIASLLPRDGTSGIPWGVYSANMLGALLFGFIWSASVDRGWISEDYRLIALVGFLGAFTTFSTFAFDNVQMLSATEWWWFGTNIVLTNIGGVIAIYAGIRLARTI